MALKAGLGGYEHMGLLHGEPGDKDALPMSREQEMGHAFSREVYLQKSMLFLMIYMQERNESICYEE